MIKKTVVTSLTVPDQTLESRLRALAACLGISFDNLVRMIIHHHVTNTGPTHNA